MGDEASERNSFLVLYCKMDILRKRLLNSFQNFAGALDADISRQPRCVWSVWLIPALLFAAAAFASCRIPSTISAGPDTLLRGCRSRSCPFHAAPSDPALLHGRNRFTKRLYCSLQRIFRPSSDDDCLPSYPVYPAGTEPSCKMGSYQQGNPLSPGIQRKPGAKYSFFLRKKDFIPPRKALASGSFIGVY